MSHGLKGSRSLPRSLPAQGSFNKILAHVQVPSEGEAYQLIDQNSEKRFSFGPVDIDRPSGPSKKVGSMNSSTNFNASISPKNSIDLSKRSQLFINDVITTYSKDFTAAESLNPLLHSEEDGCLSASYKKYQNFINHNELEDTQISHPFLEKSEPSSPRKLKPSYSLNELRDKRRVEKTEHYYNPFMNSPKQLPGNLDNEQDVLKINSSDSKSASDGMVYRDTYNRHLSLTFLNVLEKSNELLDQIKSNIKDAKLGSPKLNRSTSESCIHKNSRSLEKKAIFSNKERCVLTKSSSTMGLGLSREQNNSANQEEVTSNLGIIKKNIDPLLQRKQLDSHNYLYSNEQRSLQTPNDEYYNGDCSKNNSPFSYLDDMETRIKTYVSSRNLDISIESKHNSYAVDEFNYQKSGRKDHSCVSINLLNAQTKSIFEKNKAYPDSSSIDRFELLESFRIKSKNMKQNDSTKNHQVDLVKSTPENTRTRLSIKQNKEECSFQKSSTLR